MCIHSCCLTLVCLYMDVSQYSLVCILHMFCDYSVISTLQGLLVVFLVRRLKLCLSLSLVGCKTQSWEIRDRHKYSISASLCSWVYANQTFHPGLYFSQFISVWIKMFSNIHQMADACMLLLPTSIAVSWYIPSVRTMGWYQQFSSSWNKLEFLKDCWMAGRSFTVFCGNVYQKLSKT